MATLVLKSNPSSLANISIPDLGIEVPFGGGIQSFTIRGERIDVGNSDDVRTLVLDGAFATAGNSLILNDGVNDISDEDVLAFLNSHSTGGDGTSEGGARNTAESQVMPGRLPYLGSFSAWNNSTGVSDTNAFFGRIWLSVGTYIACEYIFVDDKDEAAADVNFAVYADDGATPPRPTGSILADGKQAVNLGVYELVRVPFTSELVVTEAGYFWIGMKSRSNPVEVSSSSHEYEEGWGDLIYAIISGYGDIDFANLTTPIFDANNKSALPFFSIVQEGA